MLVREHIVLQPCVLLELFTFSTLFPLLLHKLKVMFIEIKLDTCQFRFAYKTKIALFRHSKAEKCFICLGTINKNLQEQKQSSLRVFYLLRFS